MTRKALYLAGGLFAIAVIAGLVPWELSGERVGAELNRHLQRSSAVTVAGLDRATFTALPVPRLDIARPRLRDEVSGATAEAESLAGTLRILPLVTGRIELGELSVVRPAVTLPASGTPFAARSLRLFHDSRDTRAPGLALTRFVVVDGAVRVGRTDGTADAVLTGLSAVLRRTSGDETVDISAAAVWRGEAVEVTLLNIDTFRYFAGETVAIAAALRSRLATVQFDGKVGRAPVLQADGQLTVKTPSPAETARWLGLSLPFRGTPALQARAEARLSQGALSLAGLRMTLGTDTVDGVASLKAGEDGRVALAGTLALDRLDLSGALRALSPPRASDGGWSRDALDTAWLPAGDIDLRLSVGRLSLGSAVVTDAALALLARGGRVDATLGTGAFHRGTVKGRMSVAAAAKGGMEARGQFSLDRVDAGTALQEVAGVRRVSGTLSGSVSAETAGDTSAALVRGLEGRMMLAVRQGEIVGVNLPEVLRRMERRSLVAALDARGGRTPFELASVSGRISRGVLEITEGQVASPATRVALAGQVNLAERMFALAGTAQAQDSAGREQPVLPFEITGTFDEPLVVPDARSLIRRSGAAAPLLQGRRPEAAGEAVPAAAPATNTAP